LEQEQVRLLFRSKQKEESILHFSLPGLLPPGRTLALNLMTRTLCLLCEGPRLLSEQQFSSTELRLLHPLIQAFPHYCPYEVLLANISFDNVNERLINSSRQRLREAQLRGMWQQELRPVRRALTSIRTKLQAFNLEISNVRERGCSLTTF
jgi:hypothetical protein